MFLKLFQGQQVIRDFSKKIHTQMCITSLFRREHRKVEKNEWNDDDDEQKQIFYEEEKNSSSSGMANKSETYIIQYEGGVGIVSK
jgi:hypothetical protein|uniref:Uncharacterized protein n=1 Tax=viral metagenome TaxID=1070528 RepID=A0A6C0I1C5_9ZZZZ